MTPTILLINPPICDFAAYDFFNKPLGLLYLASVLQNAGCHVRLLDALDRNHPLLTQQKNLQLPKTQPNGTGKYINQIIPKPDCLKHNTRQYRRYGLPQNILAHALQNEAQKHPPHAVLITSMMTYWYPAVADTIKLVRQIIPHTPIALGGVYATLMPQHAQKTCQPDKLFTGGSFQPVLQWLDEVILQTRLDSTPTDKSPLEMGFRGVLSKQASHSDNDNFADWPEPAYQLYPKLDYLTLITSLGCPYHCDYCAGPNLQPKLQQLPPVQFVNQLTRLLPLLPSNKPLNIAFMDDALLAHAERHLVPILKKTAELDLPLQFHTPNGLHCRLLTPQIAKLMHANNFRMIRLSFESADAAPRWQKASDHKIKNHDLTNAVQNLKNAGYRPRDLETYILTGLPGQTLHEIDQSANFVHQLGVQVRLCQYSPIPGTPLFDDACRQFDIDTQEPLLHNNSILACLDPRISPTEFQQFKNHIKILNNSLT